MGVTRQRAMVSMTEQLAYQGQVLTGHDRTASNTRNRRLTTSAGIPRTGIELPPTRPGKWRFEIENRLVFELAEDESANRI